MFKHKIPLIWEIVSCTVLFTFLCLRHWPISIWPLGHSNHPNPLLSNHGLWQALCLWIPREGVISWQILLLPLWSYRPRMAQELSLAVLLRLNWFPPCWATCQGWPLFCHSSLEEWVGLSVLHMGHPPFRQKQHSPERVQWLVSLDHILGPDVYASQPLLAKGRGTTHGVLTSFLWCSITGIKPSVS